MYPTKLIISGFPGIGKSVLAKDEYAYIDNLVYKVYDSDSSHFSKEASFPINYMQHVQQILDKKDEYSIILISTHEAIREELIHQGIHYWLVYPEIFEKEAFLQRYRDRGNDDKFIQLLEKNYETWINDLIAFGYQHRDFVTPYQTNRYLKDILPKIIGYIDQGVE